MANCYFAKPNGMQHCCIPFFMLFVERRAVMLRCVENRWMEFLRITGAKSLFETPTLLLNSASDHPRQFAASLAFVLIIGHNHGGRPANDIDH